VHVDKLQIAEQTRIQVLPRLSVLQNTPNLECRDAATSPSLPRQRHPDLVQSVFSNWPIALALSVAV